MQKFTKQPVTIEASEPWDGTAEGATPIIDWVLANGGTARYHAAEEGSEDPYGHFDHLAVDTLEGVMRAVEGDRILRGVQGEFYPCKPDIFDATYAPAGQMLLSIDHIRVGQNMGDHAQDVVNSLELLPGETVFDLATRCFQPGEKWRYGSFDDFITIRRVRPVVEPEFTF